MDPVQKELLFNSWSKVNEIALIKVVVSRGQHIDLCVEFLSKSKNISQEEASEFFHEVIDTYVYRLLSDKSISKAQQVLKNVSRDYKSIYYQFAFESADDKIKNAIFDYLSQENSDFEDEKRKYKFYLDVLKEIKNEPKLSNIIKRKIKMFNLENFLKMDEKFQKSLIIRLYFFNKNNNLLEILSKEDIWEYLVDDNIESEIILWCKIQKGDVTRLEFELHKKYLEWKIDNKMFSYASKYLKSSSENLRDLFLFYGFIFDDEKNDIKKISDRIIRTKYTHTLDENIGVVKSFPIAEYAVENNCLVMLLQKFIQIEDIEKLKTSYPDKIELFDLIITLKSFNPTSENFLKVCQAARKYYEKEDKNYLEKNPLVALAEYLVAGKDIKSLNDDQSPEACAIKSIPLIDNLVKRLNGKIPGINAIEMFKIKTGIDLKEMGETEFGDEPASFSNSKMIAKYGMKFNLNYTHFIRQNLSSYAIYKFLMEQFNKYGQINKSQFYYAVETVSELALSDYNNLDLARHCVVFIEQLGFDSQNLRCLLMALRICNNNKLSSLDYKSIISMAEDKLLGDPNNLENIYNSEFSIKEYSALIKVAKFTGKKYWPQRFLNFLAKKDDWLKLLLFIQYFDISLDIVKNVCKFFNTPEIGENFLQAVTFEGADQIFKSSSGNIATTSKRRPSFKRNRYNKTDKHKNAANETISSHSDSGNSSVSYFKLRNELANKCLEGRIDIFALIILSTTSIPEERISSLENFLEIINSSNLYSTSFNLLKRCVQHELPILSVLSAEAFKDNIDWCWLTWLSVSIDSFKKLSTFSSEQTKQITTTMVELAVKEHYIQTLYRSFFIFYDSNFIFLLKFLELTNDLNFTDESIFQLSSFFDSLSNDEISLPFIQLDTEELHIFATKILLLHVENNFRSRYYQLKFLKLIAELNNIELNKILEFELLAKISELIMDTKIYLNFESLLPKSCMKSTIQNSYSKYKTVLDDLLEIKEYDKAIKLAYLIENVLDKPISNIIFTKWITELDLRETDFNFSLYEKDTEEHSLPPEFLVNFCLYAAVQFPDCDFRRYLFYKNALNVIKKNKLFGNESFDRDQIEFDMVMVFLRSNKNIEDIDIYHSEYYEEILLKERCVLFKTLLELKELAGAYNLTVNLKSSLSIEMKAKLSKLLDNLLENGDIVEAFRLQEMFESPTADLRYLTLCMALAEGLISVSNLTDEERSLYSNVEKNNAVFSRKTLEGRKVREPDIFRRGISNSSINLKAEEVSLKEKEQILTMLQDMTGNLKYGDRIGKRIVFVFRAAMYLDKEYTDMLRTKDTSTLLLSATNENCPKKLLVVNDIFASSQMTANEIAEYLSHEITIAIVRPVYYLLTTDQQNIRQLKPATLWGYDIDKEFHLILEICPKPSLLGKCLLKYCDVLSVYRKFQNNEEYEHSAIFESFYNILQSYGIPNEPSTSNTTEQVLSYKKKNTIYIELLIFAYKCFVHECHMEGMINVLERAQKLNSQLEIAKSWKLICRMLIGIGQYREMSYCFDTLIKNEQFESLLGAQYDDEKSQEFKYALISYLREFCPNSQEYIKLVAIRFAMFSEIAEILMNDANQKLSTVLTKYQTNEFNRAQDSFIKFLKFSPEIIKDLEEIRDSFAQAAENYLFDEKLRTSSKTAQMAQLIAMQLGIINFNLSLNQSDVGTEILCISVINVKSKKEFCELVNKNLNKCFQAMILSNSYPEYPIQWHEILLWQYIILNNENYLKEFCYHFELTDAIIENIVTGYQNYCKTNIGYMKMEENLQNLVMKIKSVTLKYRLASFMSFKNIITDILNDDNSIYYLKDTNYGEKEIVDDDLMSA
ncbi:uncharacterized protein LOC129607502 [Condylostylus longicornis]|uniref:uncharacterized protein LOC129607502 n=1 Tax=Condylostylus longicornis TaxID=2530218 RepID=UPI00244DAEDC|nr:uncharacterized protein LOC129607502 [Condylostylus longicornis]